MIIQFSIPWATFTWFCFSKLFSDWLELVKLNSSECTFTFSLLLDHAIIFTSFIAFIFSYMRAPELLDRWVWLNNYQMNCSTKVLHTLALDQLFFQIHLLYSILHGLTERFHENSNKDPKVTDLIRKQ